MKVSFLYLLLMMLTACGSRGLKPNEFPTENQGIAFTKIKLIGAPKAMVHIFTEGDRLGPHKGRIDITEGEKVYAIILSEGNYDFGQISAGRATDIWPKKSSCESFSVTKGSSSYIGDLVLSINYPKYDIKCGNELVKDLNTSTKEFEEKYPHINRKYPYVSGVNKAM